MQRLIELAADSGSAPTDPLQMLLQYGVLGIFAVMLLIYTKSSIAREREKSDQAQAEVKELNDFIRAEVLPKQFETAMLHKQVAEVLEEAIQLITEIKIRDSIAQQAAQQKPPGSSPGGRRG